MEEDMNETINSVLKVYHIKRQKKNKQEAKVSVFINQY